MAIELSLGKMLAELRERLDDPEPALRLVSASLAQETLNLIRDGFREQIDPYGKIWQPKKRADGRGTLSGKTSRLKTGWFATDVSADGFTISTPVAYALPHQEPRINPETGELKRPRRMMIPDADLGLSEAWAKVLEEDALDTMESYFLGRT